MRGQTFKIKNDLHTIKLFPKTVSMHRILRLVRHTSLRELATQSLNALRNSPAHSVFEDEKLKGTDENSGQAKKCIQ